MSFDRRDGGKQLFEYNYPGLVCAKSISGYKTIIKTAFTQKH